MATYHNFKGKIRWARVTEAAKDTKYDKEGIYTIDFYPENLDQFKASGIQSEIKYNDEGNPYVRLRRKHEQLFKKEFKVLGPPQVKYQGKDYTGTIGNDSTVYVNVETFPTAKGIGHRLSRITIIDLVEYKREETPQEQDDEIPF